MVSNGAMAKLLNVSNLDKSYGGVHAVNDCTFTVDEGSITGLIGPNGAGKSTAFDVISGFQSPDGGVVQFGGSFIQSWPSHRIAQLGLIRTFQSPRVWAGMTVMDNMLVAAPQGARSSVWRALFARGGLKAAELKDRVAARELLAQFDLLRLKDEYAGSLSAGQKRLLEFARIAIARPRMVLLDEPLAGINPVLGERIREAIREMPLHGITVLLIEHNLAFIGSICERVIVMALGRPIASGSMEDVQSNAEVVDSYLGRLPTSA
jgi:ABC-type branched-subunit amino acid transport system ATPase component